MYRNLDAARDNALFRRGGKGPSTVRAKPGERDEGDDDDDDDDDGGQEKARGRRRRGPPSVRLRRFLLLFWGTGTGNGAANKFLLLAACAFVSAILLRSGMKGPRFILPKYEGTNSPGLKDGAGGGFVLSKGEHPSSKASFAGGFIGEVSDVPRGRGAPRVYRPDADIGREPDEHADAVREYEREIEKLRSKLDSSMMQPGPPWDLSEEGWSEVTRSFHVLDVSEDNNFDDYADGEEGEVHFDDYYGEYEDDGNVDDYLDPYYADDDEVRGAREGPEYSGCRRTSFHRLHRPTCNKLHEQYLPDSAEAFLGGGYYRNAFLLRGNPSAPPPGPGPGPGGPAGAEGERAVLKSIGMSDRYDDDDDATTHMEMQRMDALVMTLLSGSPRTLGLYGHCALASVTEFAPTAVEGTVLPGGGYGGAEEEEDDGGGASGPRTNGIPVAEKLELALEMAECVADMHGYGGGVLAHVDIKMDQFMRAADGVLKIIDYNRAEVLLWDDEEGEYCKFTNGPVFGHSRAPEEIEEGLLDEQVDVYTFGNGIYSLLTGLWPFYDFADDDAPRRSIVAGDTAEINDRFRTGSFGEAALVELMEHCWIFDPEERIDIFEVVEYLRYAIETNAWVEANGIGEDEWQRHVKHTPQQ